MYCMQINEQPRVFAVDVEYSGTTRRINLGLLSRNLARSKIESHCCNDYPELPISKKCA